MMITVNDLPGADKVRTPEAQRAGFALRDQLRGAIHLEYRSFDLISRVADPNVPAFEALVGDTIQISCPSPELELKCTPLRHPKPQAPVDLPPDGPIHDAWLASQQSHMHNGLISFNTPGLYLISASICDGAFHRTLGFAVFPKRALQRLGWPESGYEREKRERLRYFFQNNWRNHENYYEHLIAALETHLVADGLDGVSRRLLCHENDPNAGCGLPTSTFGG